MMITAALVKMEMAEYYMFLWEGGREGNGERGCIFTTLQAIQPILACYVREKWQSLKSGLCAVLLPPERRIVCVCVGACVLSCTVLSTVN